MNVVFDVNIVLDLLLQRKGYYREQERCFQLLISKDVALYFPICALPTLEYVHLMELKRLQKAGAIKGNENIRQLSKEQLQVFFSQVITCTSLGAHWDAIPFDHPDYEDALISLSASLLPGDTIVWTEDGAFKPLDDILAVGDHHVVQEALSDKEDSVPFIDLVAQQHRIRTKLDKNIHKVLRHGKYIMGPEVSELEERLAAFAGVKHCIGCASGTDGLLIALMAMDIGPGDAVFTTPFTFIATAEVISLLGATPVFVDIDSKTFNIDPDNLQLAIRALKNCDPSIYPLPSGFRPPTSDLSPKGIITVDLFGLPCDYDSINAIAKKHGLFVVEDAAQGFGGKYKGKRAGSLADIGCTSFFPAKPLGCYGDGGAVLTNDSEVAETLRSIYYPKPLHLQTAFAYLGYKEGDMPISEDCSGRIFSLPMHPYLRQEEINHICNVIAQILK